MRTAGIHHVALNVRDLDEAMAYYVHGLGFTLVDRPDFGFPGAWLAVGAHQIHLIEVPGFTADRRQHVALRVDDLDAEVATLAERGVTAEKFAHVPGAGRQAFLRDPSGNRIELNQPDS